MMNQHAAQDRVGLVPSILQLLSEAGSDHPRKATNAIHFLIIWVISALVRGTLPVLARFLLEDILGGLTLVAD
jgi:hypothetical protein